MLAHGPGDVGIALGLAELGVAQDLLDDAHADALLEQEGGGSVPGVMNPGFPAACRSKQRVPVSPVVARVDRRAVGRAEDQVPLLPPR